MEFGTVPQRRGDGEREKEREAHELRRRIWQTRGRHRRRRQVITVLGHGGTTTIYNADVKIR
jgi:hypothetical protein